MAKVKLVVWIMFLILSILIGVCLGFFLGAIAFINVAEDLTDNMTLIINFDEEKIVEYAMKAMEEEYGNLTKVMIEQDLETIEINNETRRLLEEAKTHPEQKNISQTVQNFDPGKVEQ